MGTSQIGHDGLTDDLRMQAVALKKLVDEYPPPSWRHKSREWRWQRAVHLWSRVWRGDHVREPAWRGMPAALELRMRYGLTASGAWAVLRKHGAPREGRGFAPLTRELRDAIHDERLLAAARKAAADRRMAETGCSRATAVRWAYRNETVVRLPIPADSRTVEGQARTLKRLEQLFPRMVRTHTRTHK